MLRQLKTFVTVAEQKSFAKAAKKLNLPKATITRDIQALESLYKNQFFLRTTRQLSLTEQGEVFLSYALTFLQTHQEAEEQLAMEKSQVQGLLKMGLPVSILHHFIESVLVAFKIQYPGLHLEILQGNHLTDLLSSHFDLAVHCGPLPDVSFHYTKLGTWQKMLCASPQYLDKMGLPTTLEDLKAHICLDHADNHTHCWLLRINGKSKSIPISSPLRINSSMALAQAAIGDLGIVYLPSFTVAHALQKGALVPVLPQYWPDEMGIYALYPQRKQLSKKVSVMIDCLQAFLTPKKAETLLFSQQ